MRIRALLGGILGSAAVLIIGWQAGAAAAYNAATEASTGSASTSSDSSSGSSGGSSSTSSGTSTTGSGSGTTTGTPTGTSTGASTSTAAKDGTYTGDVENTPFGPMQVKVVLSGGKVTDVVALQVTNRGGRSAQISNYAVPILRKEVLSAQSAHVSTVSGATYTSDGYLSSLQSALDKAGA